MVSGPNLNNLEKWRVLGANITEDNGVVVTKCDIIFICVKPHLLQLCAQQVEGGIDRIVCDKDKLFVSVLAGISLDQLELVNTTLFSSNSNPSDYIDERNILNDFISIFWISPSVL